MSTGKGVYRGRNADDGGSGSLAGRAPLPEDRQLDDRSSYATASTSGSTKPKGNYNPPSRNNDGGRRNDDRSKERWDAEDYDRARERDRERNRERNYRNAREDKFAKQRAPPVAAPGKGDYRREDREAKTGASQSAGLRRAREVDESASSTYHTRENGSIDYNAGSSNARDRRDDWQSKRPRLDDSTAETTSSRRSSDLQTTSNNGAQSNSKGKGVYVRNEDRMGDSRANDRPAPTERKVWPPPGWDEEKEQRNRREQRHRDLAKTTGSAERTAGYRNDRGRDRNRGHDRSRRSSRSPSRSRSRSPGGASSLRTGRSPSPTSSTRSGRTGQTIPRTAKGDWDRSRNDNSYTRHRSRSRSISPGQSRESAGRGTGRRRSPSPYGRRRGPSPSLNGKHDQPRPASPGGYNPSRPSNLSYANTAPSSSQWSPPGQPGFPGMPPDQPDTLQYHQIPPPPQPGQPPPQRQYSQYPSQYDPSQSYPPPHVQHPPPLPAWPPQPPLHVDPRHFPMPPAMNNGPSSATFPPRPESFPPRDSYPQPDAQQAVRRESFPTPDMFPPPNFQANQYPPLPGQFPPLPNQFPPPPNQQHSPHPVPPHMFPAPYLPPGQTIHEGPSAADRNLSISFRQSPPIGMSQSPPGSIQGLPERQLSLGIRAPPPGPNKAGGGKFKPVAGFVPIGSATPPVDRGQLGRFFPGDDAQDDVRQNAVNQQSSSAIQQQEEQQNSAWARWEAPKSAQPQVSEASVSAQGMTRALSNTVPGPQHSPQPQGLASSYVALPTAHAPVFPGLLPPGLPALPPRMNGAAVEPPSPSTSTPSSLPSKPNFAGSLLPAFLPNKPTTPALQASVPAAQANLPLPPIPLPSPSPATASPSIPLPSREGLPTALAKFIPRSAQVSALRAEKSTEPVAEVAVAATASQAEDQAQTDVTPQTPFNEVNTGNRSPVKDASQSVQPSPAPSEPGNTKQQMEASASEAPAETPSAQEPAAMQVPPKIVNSELYERLAQVGEGTYGKVYKARRQDTGKLVALKRIRMEAEKDGFPVTAIREIKLLQSLDHPNVLKLMEMMVSKGHVYMVSEYLEHDLTGILNNPIMQSENRTFTEANLKSLMKQLLQGLDYIHWRGVLHRDLKGSNILLGKNGDLKIADFGLAKFYDKNSKNDYTNRVITLWYKPPELLFGETVYGPEVDMWSAGCIFLELFTKKPVFQGQDELHQLDVIFRYMGTPDPTTWPEVTSLPWYELVKPKHPAPSVFRETFFGNYLKSELGIQLAEALLSFNPRNRPSAKEALKHPYFTSDMEDKDEKPTWLADIKGDWHEMESKEANKRKGREARKAAAAAAAAAAANTAHEQT